jgi:interferon gamma-inducible protein 30
MTTIGAIFDFRSFPYGNANEKQAADGTWVFTCQHGVNECIGNMYEACAISHNNATDPKTNNPVWWPFFYCMEKSGNAADTTVASGCAKNNGLDWTVITTCAGSDPSKGSTSDGNPLMHNIAVATNNLIPPHQWTPWVVLNGVPLTSDQLSQSLVTLICQAYMKTCTTTPSGCPKPKEPLKLDYYNSTS